MGWAGNLARAADKKNACRKTKTGMGTELREIARGDIDWICLAQDRN
jgi:hypothetical protein